MTVKCSCGGQFRRTDIEPVMMPNGKIGYQDTDPIKANWKCLKCGNIRTQRKRQAGKKKEVTVEEVNKWVAENINDLELIMNKADPKPDNITNLVIEMLSGSLASWVDTLTDEDLQKPMKVVSINDFCKECGQQLPERR